MPRIGQMWEKPCPAAPCGRPGEEDCAKRLRLRSGLSSVTDVPNDLSESLHFSSASASVAQEGRVCSSDLTGRVWL